MVRDQALAPSDGADHIEHGLNRASKCLCAEVFCRAEEEHLQRRAVAVRCDDYCILRQRATVIRYFFQIIKFVRQSRTRSITAM